MAASIFTPISPFSFSAPPGNALRKNKSVQSCITCRRRKTKCDRQWPCTPCKTRGEADSCEPYVKDTKHRPTGYTHVSDTSILANRVAQLELALSRLIGRVDSVDAYNDIVHDFENPLPVFRPGADGKQEADDQRSDGERPRAKQRSEPAAAAPMQQADLDCPAHILASIAGTSQTFQPTPPSAPPSGGSMGVPLGYDFEPSDWVGLSTETSMPRGRPLTREALSGLDPAPSEPVSKAPSVHEHDATMELEEMALGREMHRRMSDQRDDIGPEGLPTFSSLIHRHQHSDRSLRAFPQIADLPNIIVGRYLLTHYLDNVSFLWQCLHRPTLEEQCSELFGRLRAKATEFSTSELSTIALYATCLAVGSLHLDEDRLNELGMDQDSAHHLANQCWQVAWAALDASDWMQVYDIRSCQTTIIAGLYLSSVRRANQHWTMLGTATKVAMALGLANIPDEDGIASSGNMPPRWRSAIDREVGRRVWYCLLDHDMLFCMEHDFLYLISPELNHTAEPANIDDVDLVADRPVVSKPRDTYTALSSSLTRLQLMYPVRQLVLKVRQAGRMRYNFITEAHQDILRAIEARPAFFKATGDRLQPHIRREALILSEATDLRLIRIHRYYFPASCHNSRYLTTKQTCLACARRILEAESQFQVAQYPFSWAHNYGVFTATAILVIYVGYALPDEAEEITSLAERGISQLKSMTHKGRLALGSTGDTLRALMENQLARRNSPNSPFNPLKRSLGDFLMDTWGSGQVGANQQDRLAPPVGDPPVDMGSASTLGEAHDMSFMFDSLINDYAFF